MDRNEEQGMPATSTPQKAIRRDAKLLSAGSRFGAWTVDRDCVPRGGHIYFWCVCACGRRSLVNGGKLRAGKSRSCRACSKRRHGHSIGNGTRTFRIWCGIKERCGNPSHHAYRDYGGRGIVVCQRWAESYQAFIEDMGECPPSLSIDRVNTNGHYEPGNCRWATSKTQNNNRRNNHRVIVLGVEATLAEHSERHGVKPGTAWKRIADGWPADDAFLTPVKSTRRNRRACAV